MNSFIDIYRVLEAAEQAIAEMMGVRSNFLKINSLGVNYELG
jgi:hypothetical protein